jgi:Na+/melibiose symporter-like transporter
MEKVIGIAIALFVSAIMLPVALNLLANSTTAAKMPNVDSSVRTMVAVLLPVLAVISIILVFLYKKNNE